MSTIKPIRTQQKKRGRTIWLSDAAFAKFRAKSDQTRFPMTTLADVAADLIATMKPAEIAHLASGQKRGEA